MRYILSFILLLAVQAVCGVQPYRTEIFNPNVHTLQVRLSGDPLAPPVALLGSENGIVVSFDMLEDNPQYLYYRVVHCDADWTPSLLSEVEYIDGFNGLSVDDYALSFNTYCNYVHYRIDLPNDDMRFRVSGNYALLVYHENNPDSLLLTACFSLTENLVALSCEITTRTDVDYNKAHQQLSFKVMYPQYEIRNPREEIKAVVSANADNESGVWLSQPLYVRNQEVEYGHVPQLIFTAGNEYRRFETVSRHYNTIGVESMRYFDPYYHALLRPDSPRAGGAYLYDETQKGRFFIRTDESDEADTEADYFVVHFTLATGAPLDGEVYLDGEFTHGRRDESTRLTYNHATRAYEKSLLLKQGAYNYRYVLQRPGRAADAAPIEGNFYETRNEYQIRIYHRPQGARYDRLVGYTRCRI